MAFTVRAFMAFIAKAFIAFEKDGAIATFTNGQGRAKGKATPSGR